MNKILVCLLLCFSFYNPLALAEQSVDDQSIGKESIDGLINAGKLSLALSVNHDEQQIVGQALVVSIEVSTDRWFSKGSQVQAFTIRDVVMQANNIVTINGSKRIKGQSWATQTHEITLYPTLAGKYRLPIININISVNTEDNGIVSGIISTNEDQFIVTLPQELNGIEKFIVSPDVKLSIEGLFDSDKNYAVGEAITQVITITARDTPAMMIPEINVSKNDITDKISLDGVSIYHKPPQIFDKSNRGSLTGTRIESFTYIFEKAGTYTLNEHIVYWWNSESNLLESIVIPESTWKVSSGVLKAKQSIQSFRDIKFDLLTITLIILCLILFLLTYIIYSHRLTLFNIYKNITHYEQRKLRHQFLNNISTLQYLAATQVLFKYVTLMGNDIDVQQLPLMNKLNQLAFGANISRQPSLSFSNSDAKELIEQLSTRPNNKNKNTHFTSKERIELNQKE